VEAGSRDMFWLAACAPFDDFIQVKTPATVFRVELRPLHWFYLKKGSLDSFRNVACAPFSGKM